MRLLNCNHWSLSICSQSACVLLDVCVCLEHNFPNSLTCAKHMRWRDKCREEKGVNAREPNQWQQRWRRRRRRRRLSRHHRRRRWRRQQRTADSIRSRTISALIGKISSTCGASTPFRFVQHDYHLVDTCRRNNVVSQHNTGIPEESDRITHDAVQKP